MKNIKLLPLLTVSFLLFTFCLKAQKTTISEPVNIFGDLSYVFSPKIGENYYSFSWKRDILHVKKLDNNLKSVSDKKIVTDNKFDVTILALIPNKETFNVIAKVKHKGFFDLRCLKYNWSLNLIDSTTIYSWRIENLEVKTNLILSEDKKVLLATNSGYGNVDIFTAFSLDSLKNIWLFSKKYELKNKDTQFEQWVIANSGVAFFINDEINWKTLSHQFNILKYFKAKSPLNFKFATGDNVTSSANFSFDNKNKKLVAVGVYADKIVPQINGFYFYSQSLNSLKDFVFKLTPFKDDFVSEFKSKKVKDNIGVEGLRVQKIVHRSDGGVMAIFEQARDVPRNYDRNANSSYISAIDYYYDNICPMAIDANGDKEWSQVFKKHQSSQDDGAIYSSFFLMQNPTSLRLICNDRVNRDTRVNEFLIKNDGDNEQKTVLNTQGKDIMLLLREAIQSGTDEVIIPSQILKEIKLVKINWETVVNAKGDSKYK